MTYSICRLVRNARCAVTLLMIRALFVSCHRLFRHPPSGMKLAKLSSAVTHRMQLRLLQPRVFEALHYLICCSALLHIQRAHKVLISLDATEICFTNETHAFADGVPLAHILMLMNNAYWRRIYTLAHSATYKTPDPITLECKSVRIKRCRAMGKLASNRRAH